jgi:diguanylate cyclase (GGDEF)-like protein
VTLPVGFSIEPTDPDGSAPSDADPTVHGQFLIAPPTGWSDPLSGADGPRYWDRVVLSERARARRYKRSVTVCFVELVGLEALARLWGVDVAERALVNCARNLAREIRSSDHIARIESARLAVLLTETDEIAAINFVERARASCERAVGIEALATIRLCFGWASPPAKGDLSDAIGLAVRRLDGERAG